MKLLDPAVAGQMRPWSDGVSSGGATQRARFSRRDESLDVGGRLGLEGWAWARLIVLFSWAQFFGLLLYCKDWTFGLFNTINHLTEKKKNNMSIFWTIF